MNNFDSAGRATTLRISSPKRFRARAKIKPSGLIRYGVVGLGHIAQLAVLPAFKNARRNSQLVALFSDDEAKRRELGRRYRVPHVASYEEYDGLLKQGVIDALYIALPNAMHCDFAVRAAQAGVHVLCEKPLALSERECQKMITTRKRSRVKLMTAYRLHFEKSNLEAVKIARSGRIGELRYFSSIFSMQARAPNIRLDLEMGGGPLWDRGVYCINAARYLFGEEPLEVLGVTAAGRDKRFREVEEMVSATLRFPGERLATFLCSFGAADAALYDIVGTEGRVNLKNSYEYTEPIQMQSIIGDHKQVRKFELRDQFAPELLYFSDCVLRNKEPEPSGQEGLADVRIIEAIYRSSKSKKLVKLARFLKSKRPSLRQEVRRPPVRKPQLVHAHAGSG
jgi:glucose-fructose oxidoreductase